MCPLIVLPDGNKIKAEYGQRILDLIPKSSGLVAKIDGRLVDLTLTIPSHSKIIEILDFNSKEGREVYWHTSAHILAQAVKRLFPHAMLGISTTPPTGIGFCYDFYVGEYTFTPEDLKKIEKEMKKIIKENLSVVREELSIEEAKELFSRLNEKFKLELLEEMNYDVVTVYRQGEFVDLCKGPHLPSTGFVKFVKILSVASAYWRGDESRESMQRICGVSFPTREMLEEHLKWLEEVKRRDHRVIGPSLNLFSMPSEVIGPGLILWHPKGALIRSIIEDYLRKIHLKHGYQLVYTPHIAYSTLWQISGHLEYYKDLMYAFEKEGIEHVVKPMNCPFHILIYKFKRRSYRELPIRYFELGTVYRYERSGTLHGLLRARGFTQDDAHIFCTKEQLHEEVVKVLSLMEEILSDFGFEKYEVELSTWDPNKPEEYMGTREDWKNAESALKEALREKGYSYTIMPGEAAFYGPKIDVKLIDAIGRRWQCTTIQVDFNLPKRFNVTYIGPDGKEHLVVMVHRALLGSVERFFGILVEHYAGDFPLWLAPIQVRVIPVSNKFNEYALKVCKELSSNGIRVDADTSNASLAYKVRQGELEKIPYVIIVGRKEESTGTISIRRRKVGDLGRMKLEEFIERIKKECKKF